VTPFHRPESLQGLEQCGAEFALVHGTHRGADPQDESGHRVLTLRLDELVVQAAPAESPGQLLLDETIDVGLRERDPLPGQFLEVPNPREVNPQPELAQRAPTRAWMGTGSSG
jgi:hypothetical protein